MLSLGKLLLTASPLLGLVLGLVPAPVPDPILLDGRSIGAVSPNLTCGTKEAGGSPNGYTCPTAAPCCSSHGFCGTGDGYCLNTGGCQASFSEKATSCYAPVDGVSVTPDGTCGKAGAGTLGYKCDTTSTNRCCSAS